MPITPVPEEFLLPIELAKTICKNYNLAFAVVFGHFKPTNRWLRCTYGVEAIDKIRSAELAAQTEEVAGVDPSETSRPPAFDFRDFDAAQLVECVERLSDIANELRGLLPTLEQMLPGTAARYRDAMALAKKVVPYV